MSNNSTKPTTVYEYIASVPSVARPQFDILRSLVKKELPKASELFSYGIVGYKIDEKRARVFVSGWKDHVAMYPVPKDEKLRTELIPYIKGKGTLWFSLQEPLPVDLVKRITHSLTQ